jgi:lipoate-protein ligase A
MIMHLLPERTSDAAGNMATDFLLLRRYEPEDVIRFRHSEWRRAAYTFGYGQKVEFARQRFAADGDSPNHTRRATGGGVVDHRNDWTYALVLPRAHPLWDRAGPAIYHAVHEVLSATLNECGADTRLQTAEPETEPGVCFERPEVDDVVNANTGVKVAGAAIKRSKQGVLLQGSIWRPFLPKTDWEQFGSLFPRRLADSLDGELRETGWPDFDPDEEEALIAQYDSEEWIARR